MGIVGDVALEIRPEVFVSDVFPQTSVREQSIRVDVETRGPSQGLRAPRRSEMAPTTGPMIAMAKPDSDKA